MSKKVPAKQKKANTPRKDSRKKIIIFLYYVCFVTALTAVIDKKGDLKDPNSAFIILGVPTLIFVFYKLVSRWLSKPQKPIPLPSKENNYALPKSEKKRTQLAEQVVKAAIAEYSSMLSAPDFVVYTQRTLQFIKYVIAMRYMHESTAGGIPFDTAVLRAESHLKWRTKDAIEKEYTEIVSLSKGIYRNNTEYITARCRLFADSIDVFAEFDFFDDDLRTFADDYLARLARQFPVFGEHAGIRPTDISKDITNVDYMSGAEFERFCAELLIKNGYINVNISGASGDQGVDITAEKDGVKYAIQCKCYSRDLGNTPVQEVSAGKQHYGCHLGVVMTNRRFSRGAQALAQSTGVLLWDRDKLMELME